MDAKGGGALRTRTICAFQHFCHGRSVCFASHGKMHWKVPETKGVLSLTAHPGLPHNKTTHASLYKCGLDKLNNVGKGCQNRQTLQFTPAIALLSRSPFSPPLTLLVSVSVLQPHEIIIANVDIASANERSHGDYFLNEQGDLLAMHLENECKTIMHLA